MHLAISPMRPPVRLLLALTVLAIGCGGDESMASKSAAAYREARAEGTPVGGGHEHGGHEAAGATGATAPVDHSAHGTGADPHAGHTMTTTGDAAEHGAHGTRPAAGHTAMDHGAHGAAGTGGHAQHGTTSNVTAEHGGHAATAGAAAHDQHAGMQHGTSTAATDAHAQHQPSARTPEHAGHGAMQPAAGAPEVVLHAPTSSAEMARTHPAGTLQPDEFDAPAAISVEEARKASGGAPPQGIYACPMHPEVTSATPGKCPKCGMTLVKQPAGHAGHGQ